MPATRHDSPGYLRMLLQITNNYAGSPNNAIVKPLASSPGEPVARNNTMDAFASWQLGGTFAKLGANTVVYVGVSTNNCVETTQREAADRDYASLLVSYATGHCSDRVQEAAPETFLRLNGRVVSTDQAIAELLQSSRGAA